MVQKEDIWRKIEEENKEILEFLREIVEFETPTTDRSAVHSLGDELSKRFSKYLPEKEVLGDDYKVFLLKQAKGKSIFLLHLDTVHPKGTLAKNPFRRENSKVYGPGVLDMKGGITALYFAVKYASQFGKLPEFSILMNTEEEEGSRHTLDHMKLLANSYKYCFDLEPAAEGGRLKTTRKGVVSIRIESKGRRAHAGIEPEKGINAIDELVDQIVELKDWVILRGGMFNTGVIRGGDRPNVVPGSAYALVDIRFEEEGFSKKLREYMNEVHPKRKDAVVLMSFDSYVPPFLSSTRQRKLYSRMKKFFSELGIKIDEAHSNGGSDASWFSKWGLASIDGLGPEGKGAHSSEEYLYFNSLKERILLLSLLLLNLNELAP